MSSLITRELFYNEEAINQLYENNHMYERMDHKDLIEGELYTLAIIKYPGTEFIGSNFMIRANMIFLRHATKNFTEESPHDTRVLQFSYEYNPTVIGMDVENHPVNRVYRLRKVSDQMKEPEIIYINNNTTEPNANKTKIIDHPETSAHIVFNKFGVNDPLLQNYMGNFGGKRKNNKKKTQSKKKTAGKKGKSVRKKSKSLKKNRKTKKSKKN